MSKKIIVTKNSKETTKLGYDFGKSLKGGDVVCLYGDLGSGKTTFTQGLAKGLGIKQRIISPTFIIVRNYKTKTYDFYHIDLYRTDNDRDIEGLGIEEIINNPENIVVIEWAEKLNKYLPKKRIDIKFMYKEVSIREITISSL